MHFDPTYIHCYVVMKPYRSFQAKICQSWIWRTWLINMKLEFFKKRNCWSFKDFLWWEKNTELLLMKLAYHQRNEWYKRHVPQTIACKNRFKTPHIHTTHFLSHFPIPGIPSSISFLSQLCLCWLLHQAFYGGLQETQGRVSWTLVGMGVLRAH